jgi:tetratricopeptide (TPR) repeat protein
MKSTSGCVRILALSCTLGVLLALYLPSSVHGQTTSAVDYYNRAHAKSDKGDYDGAIADLNRAIELDPKYASAYNNRGLAKQGKGDLDGAIADWTRAIELNPKLVPAYYNRAHAKSDKGDYDGAIADFNRAIELNPKLGDAYYDRGVDKQAKGDLDGAIADWTRAIKLDPKYVPAYYNRGVAKQEKGDLNGARADYNRAVELDPNMKEAQDGLKRLGEPSSNTVQTETAAAGVNEVTPGSEPILEWRQRIRPQHVESVESAEALAVAVNSARVAAARSGTADDRKDVATAVELFKSQDLSFTEKDLLGSWRCRSIQVGDLGAFVYPFFKCRFVQKDGKLSFEKTTGSQRRSGFLYPSASDRMVFLGSLTMNDDPHSGEYTDTVGVLVRKASNRFLLILDATRQGYETYEIVK